MSELTRVMIVEDHFVARLGIQGLIADQPDMEVAVTLKNGAEAVQRYAEVKPDLVLMDMRMPGFDGIQATAALLSQDPEARILIVSSYDTEVEVGRVLGAGAKGYIMKEADGEQLLAAARTVASGQSFVPEALRERLDTGSDQPKLNAREIQFLDLIAKGCSNREIAERVDLTPGTVRIYVSKILAKMNVSNRAEAVSAAIDRGLLRPTR